MRPLVAKLAQTPDESMMSPGYMGAGPPLFSMWNSPGMRNSPALKPLPTIKPMTVNTLPKPTANPPVQAATQPEMKTAAFARGFLDRCVGLGMTDEAIADAMLAASRDPLVKESFVKLADGLTPSTAAEAVTTPLGAGAGPKLPPTAAPPAPVAPTVPATPPSVPPTPPPTPPVQAATTPTQPATPPPPAPPPPTTPPSTPQVPAVPTPPAAPQAPVAGTPTPPAGSPQQEAGSGAVAGLGQIAKTLGGLVAVGQKAQAAQVAQGLVGQLTQAGASVMQTMGSNPVEAGVKALAHNPENLAKLGNPNEPGFADRAMKLWSEMPQQQQIWVLGGASLALVGLLSSLTGGGMGGAALGLGGLALGAAGLGGLGSRRGFSMNNLGLTANAIGSNRGMLTRNVLNGGQDFIDGAMQTGNVIGSAIPSLFSGVGNAASGLAGQFRNYAPRPTVANPVPG